MTDAVQTLKPFAASGGSGLISISNKEATETEDPRTSVACKPVNHGCAVFDPHFVYIKKRKKKKSPSRLPSLGAGSVFY